MSFYGEEKAAQKVLTLVGQFGACIAHDPGTGEQTYRFGDAEVVTKQERTWQKSYRISSAFAVVSGSTFRGCVDGVSYDKGGQSELNALLEKLTAESEQVQAEKRRQAIEEFHKNYVPPVNRFTGQPT